MAGLPYARDTTLNPGSQVPSSLLNNLQDWQVHGWDAIGGKDVFFHTDFLGPIGTTPLTLTHIVHAAIVDDSALDGFGALSLPPNAGDSEVLQSQTVVLVGRKWRFFARMRFAVAPTNAGSTAFVGLTDVAHGGKALLEITGAGGAKWNLVTNGGSLASTLAMDLVYHTFDMRSDGTMIELWIDGALVGSIAQDATFKPVVMLQMQRAVGDIAVCDLRIDCVKLWVAR